MKASRIKHVLITSVIFLIIIAIIVFVYQKQLEQYTSGDLKEQRQMITVTQDIKVGDKIVVGIGGNAKVQKLRTEIVPENYISDESQLVNTVAIEPMYKDEVITASRVMLEKDTYKENERLYSIPFDAASTGGYNIERGEYVDICVLYETKNNTYSSAINNGYQNLPANKLIDVVLSNRMIADIRDESGTSIYQNDAVKPGFICFYLTYDEINKIELAKKQGDLFIGKIKNYVGEAHEETFMKGITLPKISPEKVVTNTPVVTE